MEERKGLICWIKKHKKKLVVTGISIGALISVVLALKNREKIKAIWDSLRKVVEQPTAEVIGTVTEVAMEIPSESSQQVGTAVVSTSESLPFEVRRHIRNLPDGWHASPKKIAEARRHNIILIDGQTWVDSYKKKVSAA